MFLVDGFDEAPKLPEKGLSPYKGGLEIHLARQFID